MEESVLNLSLQVSFVLLGASLIFVVMRMFQGPSLSDRVIAIDLFGTILLSAILLFAIQSKTRFYLDVGVVFSLFAFLGTVVFARFIERQGPKS